MARGTHTITEEIALNGGADIEKEFAALGEAGVKAFAELKKAAQGLNNQSETSKFINQLKKDIKSLQKQVVELGVAYKEVGKAGKEFGRHLTEIAAVGVAAGAAVFEFTKHATELVDSTGKAAQSAGLAIEEYGKLQFVFEQGDVSAEQFGTAIKQLNKNIFDAARGVGEGKVAFDSLGISVKNSDGSLRSATDIINDIADRFSKMPDGVNKSAAAVKLFGRAGALMIPALNDGSKAMRELEQQAVDLGIVFDKTSFKIAQEFNDSLNALKRGIGGVATQVGLELAPAFTEAFKALTQLLIDNRTRILEFGKSVSDAIIPLIKDFSLLLQGKDSEVANKGLIQLRDTIVSIGQAVGAVANIFNLLFQGLVSLIQPFVDIINEMFGTKFTAEAAVVQVVIFALAGGFKLVSTTINAARLTWLLFVKFFGSNAAIVAAAIAGVLGIIAELQITLENARATAAAWGVVIADAFNALPGIINAVWQGILAGADALGKSLVDIFSAFQKRGFGVFSDLVDSVLGIFEDLGKSIQGIIDGIINGIQAAIKAAVTLGGLLPGGGGDSGDSGGGGGGFARGGMIVGRGTGTSDSILARVSNGEYIVRARAVSKYGLGLLNAINGMRFSVPKFALGGPVLASGPSMPALPALAASGPSGRPLSLTIGTETFEGLLAPETVATKMVHFARVKATRSAGRKPSWR